MNVYVLPYYKTKSGRVQVMLGYKKIYTYDGAVFNNPNQTAVMGGKVEHGEDRKDAALREFREETGMKLNKENITHEYKTEDYVAYYYEVTDKTGFSKINNEDKHFDKKIVELSDIAWEDHTESTHFMKSELNMNPISHEQVTEYMTAWKAGKWGYNNVTAALKKYIRNDKEFNAVLQSIKYKGSNTFHYELFYNFFCDFIQRKQEKNEWFHNIVMNL